MIKALLADTTLIPPLGRMTPRRMTLLISSNEKIIPPSALVTDCALTQRLIVKLERRDISVAEDVVVLNEPVARLNIPLLEVPPRDWSLSSISIHCPLR